MKKIILNFAEKSDIYNELVQEAFNMNFLDFLVSKDTFLEFENIERITTYSRDLSVNMQNLIINDANEKPLEMDKGVKIGLYSELKSKQDEEYIIGESKKGNFDFIIVKAQDWKVIPFENLIAEMHKNDTELIASVENINEAELMLKTLEVGTDGILITPKEIDDIIELKKLLISEHYIELVKAKVINLQNIPESERVCVDTTSLLHSGEGMLVGSTAKGFALVHAEVFETQFVSSRPFRVNAGDVSAYILVPSDNKDKEYQTKYLSELKGGDRVIAVKNDGVARIITVGRVKIETRPMLRLELEIEKEGNKIKLNYIGQNAETIRLVKADGEPVSIVDIKVGDEVLVHIGPGATHFGTKIKETIVEK
ncbi:MAG: 3-dehydroquinate synthase II [Candidatus Lokiarchaeota archaeon]|nr:3-dehydroquinate synthase II [Candidatus Lokiarchaeota archaeon]